MCYRLCPKGMITGHSIAMSELIYRLEDRAATRYADSLEMVSIPEVWEWTARIDQATALAVAEIPNVAAAATPAPPGSKIGRDCTDPKKIIVPRSYLGKLQSILTDIEKNQGTRQPDGAVLQRSGIESLRQEKVVVEWKNVWVKNKKWVDPPAKPNLTRIYRVPAYLCDEVCDTRRFRRAE